jgi:hypothetical protein
MVPVRPLAPLAFVANAARSVVASASADVSARVRAATLNASYAARVKASAGFLARLEISRNNSAFRLASFTGKATSGLG